jgi:hypothetical protein
VLIFWKAENPSSTAHPQPFDLCAASTLEPSYVGPPHGGAPYRIVDDDLVAIHDDDHSWCPHRVKGTDERQRPTSLDNSRQP